MVGRDLEEVNGWFDYHRGEINCLKTREKEAKEKVDQLGGFIIGAGHEAAVFKNCLDRMEDNLCKCACTPSCQGHSTLSSQRVFEGTWLTQLVRLVTADRLFPCHKGRVDLSNR